MTEERLESTESTNHAMKIVQILIGLGYSKDSFEFSEWLKKVQLLQTLLSHYWQNDPTGKLTVKCLNHLYSVIALNVTPIGPAVWSILELVPEEKISEFVEGILSDPNLNDNVKVQNVLTATIKGLCQSGPFAPRLQDWIFAIVQGLEARKNYTVLIEVSEIVILKLIQLLMVPLYRPLIYPTFRQFLYPIVTPHVFYKILGKIPDLINMLLKDIEYEDKRMICFDFGGLIKNLLCRFPPTPSLEAKYTAIKLALLKVPETTFEPDSLTLWDPAQDKGSSDWIVKPATYKYEDLCPQMPYRGLINQGNTCFMNSILQVLYMTTCFRIALLEKELDPSERAAADLQQLFALMQESNRRALVPNGVMNSTFPPTFLRGHQQDSSEYLIYLLDTLHENENKIIRRKRQSNSLYKDEEEEKKREGNGDFEEGAVSLKYSDQSTVVEKLFGGVTMSTTICSFCKRSFPKNDNFRDLHLSLPDDYKSCDLQELINVSLEPEELCSDNMYDCASCGTKRNATRKHTIVKAPQHLILTLKLFRFDPVRRQRLKLHSRLKNAKSIELPVYNSSQLQTQLVMYELKGVVLHSGSSLDGGHYFSSAVDQSGQWYIFNDSNVSLARYGWNSGGGTPYILVLRQSNICDPPIGPLPSNLQLLVNRDNQKFMKEKR